MMQLWIHLFLYLRSMKHSGPDDFPAEFCKGHSGRGHSPSLPLHCLPFLSFICNSSIEGFGGLCWWGLVLSSHVTSVPLVLIVLQLSHCHTHSFHTIHSLVVWGRLGCFPGLLWGLMWMSVCVSVYVCSCVTSIWAPGACWALAPVGVLGVGRFPGADARL